MPAARKASLLLVLSALNLPTSTLLAQGTAITYQGRLDAGGGPANGSYDLRFKLFLDPLGNTQAGTAVLTNGVPVANGLFTVTLDFGTGMFNGNNYWLEIDVKTNGAAGYSNLNPLQALTAVPYAVFAENAAGGALAAGTYTNAVTLNNTSNSFAGTFNGNGAGVTNVNALTLGGLAASGFWQVGGNNVTNGQFIGSTNNQPVEIWANGTRALRFEPNTNGAPNVIGGAPVNYVDPGIVGATIAGGGTVSGNFYLGGGSNHVSAIFGTIAGGRVNTVAADHAFIGGGISNTIQGFAYDSVIGGGVANVIADSASESVVVGGTYNAIQPSASYSFIGGGSGNSIQANGYLSVLGGGSGNSIQTVANNAFLGGGAGNSVQFGASYSVLGGGSGNSIQSGASYAVLGGGSGNSIQPSDYYSFLGGGYGNSIQANASYSFVGGGYSNSIQINAGSAFLGGGRLNSIRSNANHAVISGGYNNTVRTNAAYAAIGGGYGNLNGGSSAVVAGGSFNANTGDQSSIGGGSANSNGGYAGTVAGGQNNTNSGFASTIGGGQNNLATNQTATISGGWGNLSGGFVATVGGGYFNRGLGDYATVAGGYNNSALAGYGFVGGGTRNFAGGAYATVAGGYGDTANGYAAAVGGGTANSAGGNYATASGGYSNLVGGSYATVGGGCSNIAAGDFSFAAGTGAQTLHDGAFVWSDGVGGSFASTAANQFSIHAGGGLRCITSGAGLALDGPAAVGDIQMTAADAGYHHLQLSGGNSLGFLYGAYNPLGDGIYLGYNYYWDANGFGHPINSGGATSRISVGYGEIDFFIGGVSAPPNTRVLVANSSGVCLPLGTFSCSSDRNAKQDFAPVSASEILARVVRLPVTQWSYKVDAKTRHIGPMAQDFYAAFDVGIDDKHIAPIDEGGVALAAIQGLNQKEEENRAALEAKEAEIQELKAQNLALSKRLSDLERSVAALAGRP